MRIVTSTILIFVLGLTSFSSAQESVTKELSKVSKDLTAKKYQFAYKFKHGEVIRSKVTHLSTVETTIKGFKNNAQSRTISTKIWKVEKVDPSGNITFLHSVDAINMWQKVTDRPEQKYNSEEDETPPAIFQEAAKAVGVDLARITIDKTGKVIAREKLGPSASSATNEVTIRFPADPIEIGARWYSPHNISAQTASGKYKLVKTRQKYTLMKVSDNIAVIDVASQILTPIDDPSIKVELLQHLHHGQVKFDIARGRIISQQLDQDETIIGFQGEASKMNFLARMSEELIEDESKEVASSEKTAVKVADKKENDERETTTK